MKTDWQIIKQNREINIFYCPLWEVKKRNPNSRFYWLLTERYFGQILHWMCINIYVEKLHFGEIIY